MIWGFAGPWYGEFDIWRAPEEEQTLARLTFAQQHRFQSANIDLAALQDPRNQAAIENFVAEHDFQLTTCYEYDLLNDDLDQIQRDQEIFLTQLEQHHQNMRCPLVTTSVRLPTHRFQRAPAPNLAEQLERLSDALQPLVTHCRSLGCAFGIENHGDYYCSDLASLCEQTPGLGIFLDTGNCFLIGENPISATKDAAPYVVGTHFKDHRVHSCHRSLSFQLSGAALGDGDVGLADIYSILLAETPNPNKLVMHWEMIKPEEENGLETIRRSWEFIKQLPSPEETLI